MLRSSRALVALALGTVYLVWSSTYLALHWVVEELPPMGAAGARFIGAGLVLLAFVRLRRGRLPSLRTATISIPLGILVFAVGNGFVSIAQRTVSSGTAAVACAAMPCFAAALEILGGQRAHRRELAGIGLGLAGVLVLNLDALRGDTSTASVLLVLAPIGWALGSILSKRHLHDDPLGAAAVQMVAGGVAALALGAALGETWPAAVSARAALAWLYLLVVGSLVAFSAYAYLLHHTRVGVATSYAFVNPVLALLLGGALGGEALKPTTLPAIALVLGGLALVLRRGPTPRAAATSAPLAVSDSP